jgi:hypothetical protein
MRSNALAQALNTFSEQSMTNEFGKKDASKGAPMLLEGLEARDLYIRNISANLSAAGELTVMLEKLIAELKIAVSGASSSDVTRDPEPIK